MIQDITPDNVVVIYHDPCNDGFCSAFLLWLEYPQAKFIPVNHNPQCEPPYDDLKDMDVIIVDYSYPIDELLAIVKIAKSLTVLDHHKTASHIQKLIDDKIIKGRFDVNSSGAGLTLDWLLNQGFESYPWMHELVAYVQDADLWNWVLPNSLEFHLALSSYKKTFQTWHNMPRTVEIISLGSKINQYRESFIVEHVNNATIARLVMGKFLTRDDWNSDYFWDVPFVVCTIPQIVSELGHRLAKDNPFAVILVPNKNGIKYSLRSVDGGLDVSVIAKSYGGGGHKHAASFYVNGSICEGLL